MTAAVVDCAVHVVTDQPATAEVGVTLAPGRYGRGLASDYCGAGRRREALAAVMTRLFEDCSVHRIYAEADDRNLAVHRLLERLGFRCAARVVEADWFKSEWSTLRVFAILRREWES